MSEVVNSGPISFQQKQSYDYHMSLVDVSNSEIMLLDLDVSDLIPDYLSTTINRLFKEIDSFRTVFAEEGGVVLQQVLKFKEQDNFYFDILDNSKKKYDETIKDDLIAMVSSTMGLAGGSLLCKCIIVNFDHGMRRCMFFIHHIIVDLWSILIIKKKFYEIYNRYVANSDDLYQSAKTAYNMIDYANEQQEAYNSKGLSGILYWHNKLAPAFMNLKAPFIDITGKREVRLNEGNSEDSISSMLDNGECGFIALKIQDKALDDIYQILKESNTGFMALFNMVFSLLPWYFGVDKRVLIASPVNNRLNSRLKSVIGLCGGSIYTYLDIKFDLTLSQIIKDTYIDVLKSFKNAITEHTIFKLDGRQLREKCDLFLNITAKEFENKIPENYYREEGFEGKRTYYALQCSIHEQEGHISMIWGYNKNFYTKMQVEELAGAVFNLLELLKSSIDKPLTNLCEYKNGL